MKQNPNLFSTTNSLYFPDYATWCVKMTARKASWKNIFFIFSTNLWIAVILIFVFTAIASYYYAAFNEGRKDFYWVMMCALKANIGFMPGFSPKKIGAKAIFFLFLIYGLNLSTLFQSATVYSMTGYYYQEQISSLTEAIENDYIFAGSDFSANVLSSRNDTV